MSYVQRPSRRKCLWAHITQRIWQQWLNVVITIKSRIILVGNERLQCFATIQDSHPVLHAYGFLADDGEATYSYRIGSGKEYFDENGMARVPAGAGFNVRLWQKPGRCCSLCSFNWCRALKVGFLLLCVCIQFERRYQTTGMNSHMSEARVPPEVQPRSGFTLCWGAWEPPCFASWRLLFSSCEGDLKEAQTCMSVVFELKLSKAMSNLDRYYLVIRRKLLDLYYHIPPLSRFNVCLPVPVPLLQTCTLTWICNILPQRWSIQMYPIYDRLISTPQMF